MLLQLLVLFLAGLQLQAQLDLLFFSGQVVAVIAFELLCRSTVGPRSAFQPDFQVSVSNLSRMRQQFHALAHL